MTNTVANTNIGHNSKAVDLKAEFAFMQRMRTDFLSVQGKAADAACSYVEYSLSTGNCDLIRHFFEALPDLYQPKLVTWLRTVAPIQKRVKTNKETKEKTISFGLDKERIKEEGYKIYSNEVFSIPFFNYKKPKSETVLELKKLISQLSKKAESTRSKLDNFEVDADVLAKLNRLAGKLDETLACAGDILDIKGSYSYDASTLPGQREAANKSATKGKTDNVHNLEA
jgi:hypothetical protein